MLAGMLIRRAITTKRSPTLLAGAQVHPAAVCFYTFFAYIVLGVLKLFYSSKVFANAVVFHNSCELLAKILFYLFELRFFGLKNGKIFLL
jgi:hypothetical protein